MLLQRTRIDRCTLPGDGEIADRASWSALLNCLIRECALPGGWLLHAWPDDRRGLSGMEDAGGGEQVPLQITMPDGAGYFVLVDRRDRLGSHFYRSDLWGRRPGEAWRQLDLADFARDLLPRCVKSDEPVNSEMLGQILASRDALDEVLSAAAADRIAPLANYPVSEQALWFGHPAHPAPKTRAWPDEPDRWRYAPEFGGSFRLRRWAVDADGLTIRSNGLAPDAALRAVADQAGAKPGQAILSLHPVQARLLRADPRVRALFEAARIEDLGETGALVRATASVRTLMVDGQDHLLKTSLSIRITNCVRKNAWYELESAVLVDRLIAGLVACDPDGCGGLHTIPEPASVSWAPFDASDEDACWYREQTGIILRRDFRLDHGPDALVASTLFGRDTRFRPLIPVFLRAHVGCEPDAATRLLWFARYQALLLRPVLTMFFRHGVVFEPHLQNCVVTHHDGWPECVLLRDFEGVKLTVDRGVDLLGPAVPERIVQSLVYPRERGWQRIAYCLFVNNLSEAVLALTDGMPDLAPTLWQIVFDELLAIRGALDNAPELDALIGGAPIPCKANLRVRLAAAPDREADYVALAAPWGAAR